MDVSFGGLSGAIPVIRRLLSGVNQTGLCSVSVQSSVPATFVPCGTISLTTVLLRRDKLPRNSECLLLPLLLVSVVAVKPIRVSSSENAGFP